MRINTEQVTQHLKGKLASIYLFTGAEPLQLQEAYDLLIVEARKKGFNTRTRLDANTGFDGSLLRLHSQNFSLLSDQQLIEISLPAGNPGSSGSEALCEYAENPPPDTLLMVRTGKLESSAAASKWIKMIEKHGVIIQSWPIPLDKIPQWLAKRLALVHLQTDKHGLNLLAERIEGNLLAGAQAVEKLHLLYGEGNLTVEHIATAISDSAQYDVFALVDAGLQGNLERCLHILNVLQEEGVAAAIVLWAMLREIRLLATLCFQLKSIPLVQVLNQAKIWEKRKPLVAAALQRISLESTYDLLEKAHLIDRAIKGGSDHDPWEGLSQLCLQLAKPSLIKKSTYDNRS
ncbi:MAG: polymerase subunit delta [Gammaproteobacteria bacterium]|nr:polymerase subunit delta [Gammaproteobacteria bacterium]